MDQINEIEETLRSAVKILENVDNTIERYELMNTHGGARRGAGRKALPNAILRSLKMDPEHWEKAKKIGDGNASKGVRIAIEQFKQ